MVESLVLKKRDVEFVGNKTGGNMVCKRGMSLHWRQLTRPAAFIRGRIGLSDAESKRGIVVEEERRDVIVENEKQYIRFLFGEPIAHRLITLENGRPDRIVLFLPVKREPNGGRVRACNSPDYFCHRQNTLPLYDRGKSRGVLSFKF